ncbi:trigger factor [Roseinatronobacter thiooxidans]|uniref:Trigger factor n=1 Tax=Roseinatronobacter thiooxidans TaxID=121821 RepID=A0A2W7QFA3_9RHOB|nr:trigger factor [Roseinatronobacter thiooxidans]PZX46076.1 trigger factor [Roseinatronobacter thiooxidans]
MQVTETLNEGLKRGYTITVTAAELAAKVDEKLVEAQPEIEMKGFRKGKVPMALLKKQFGQRLLGEAMQDAVDGAMNKHFEDSGDRPAAQPDVKMTNEDWKEGDDVVVALNYEALPKIDAPDFSGIALEKLVVKADDAAVQEALENLAKNAQNFDDKDGAAEDGDQITMDFVGKIDGEAFEGGTAEDFPLVLGSGQFIPGFEEQLVGVKAGEEKAVTVNFPADYGAEHLAGKEAVFDCTVKAVKAPAEAVIDDELAKHFGAESLEALKTQISERLEAEYAQASRAVLKRGLLDALDAAVNFDLPPSLVEAESKQIAHQLWHDAQEDVDQHDHSHGEVETTEESDKLAVRRVKLGLLLAEIGQKAEVEVTDQEMTQAVIAQARQYPGQERAFFEFIQKNPQMQQQLRAPIFEDKVVDHIIAQVAVTEKEIGKDDLQKAIEELENEA